MTLNAVADPGSVFTGWGGACNDNAPQCEVTLRAAKLIRADFGPEPVKPPNPPKPGPEEIQPPPSVIPDGVGYLYTNRLFLRIRCPQGFKPTCNVAAQALTKKTRGKAMTKIARKSVKRGTWKKAGLLIKKQYRKKFEKFAKTPNKRTVTVRLRVRSKKGKRKGDVFYRLRVKTNRSKAPVPSA